MGDGVAAAVGGVKSGGGRAPLARNRAGAGRTVKVVVGQLVELGIRPLAAGARLERIACLRRVDAAEGLRALSRYDGATALRELSV